MTSIRQLLRRLWYVIRREQYLSELEEEMRLHTELRAESLHGAGMSAEQASAEARRRFGNVTNIGERSLDMWGLATLDRTVQD